MNIKSLVFYLLVRLFLIILTIFLGVYFYIKIDKFFSIIGTIALFIAQIIWLIHYIKNIDFELTNFFSSIISDDYHSININSPVIKRHSELSDTLSKFKSSIIDIKEKTHAQDTLIKGFLENVDTGIILFDHKGKIYWQNSTALRLLSINHLSSIISLWDNFPELEKEFGELNSGERKIFKLNIGHDLLTLSIKKSIFKIKETVLTLFAFDHISNEYNEIEQESWEKLIRVFTHEIMNTLTPITSLTDSLKLDLSSKDIDQKITQQQFNKSLNLIKERSNGLLEFVKKYREITITPVLNKTRVSVIELMYNIRLLFNEKGNLQIEIDVKPIDLEIFVDKDLFSQIIINLIKNAIEASVNEDQCLINISVYRTENKKVKFEIRDYGEGIDKNILHKVFIPFFTTKKSGSGIGLSYSRKIIRLHGGKMEIQNSSVRGTIITLSI